MQPGKELYFTVGGQHMPFGASPQVKSVPCLILLLLWSLELIISCFEQDVWTELGRPCGIHPKQVIYTVSLNLFVYHDQMLPLASLTMLPALSVTVQYSTGHLYFCFWIVLCFPGRSNGYSFCVRSSTKNNYLWWLLLQLFYSWFGHPVWWRGRKLIN